jgi:hypothetical protein
MESENLGDKKKKKKKKRTNNWTKVCCPVLCFGQHLASFLLQSKQRVAKRKPLAQLEAQQIQVT